MVGWLRNFHALTKARSKPSRVRLDLGPDCIRILLSHGKDSCSARHFRRLRLYQSILVETLARSGPSATPFCMFSPLWEASSRLLTLLASRDVARPCAFFWYVGLEFMPAIPVRVSLLADQLCKGDVHQRRYQALGRRVTRHYRRSGMGGMDGGMRYNDFYASKCD